MNDLISACGTGGEDLFGKEFYFGWSLNEDFDFSNEDADQYNVSFVAVLNGFGPGVVTSLGWSGDHEKFVMLTISNNLCRIINDSKLDYRTSAKMYFLLGQLYKCIP